MWLSEDNTDAAVLVKVDGVARRLRKAIKELDAIGREWQQMLVSRKLRRLAGGKRGRPTGDRPAVK